MQVNTEDEMDCWLCGELQQLLSTSHGGTALMHGMRKLLVQPAGVATALAVIVFSKKSVAVGTAPCAFCFRIGG